MEDGKYRRADARVRVGHCDGEVRVHRHGQGAEPRGQEGAELDYAAEDRNLIRIAAARVNGTVSYQL